MIISHRDFAGPLKPVWLGTSIINYVTPSTCLGITIDNKLSWNKQLSKVTTSFNSKLKELSWLRYLPVNVKEKIYYKTVVSSITYCISVHPHRPSYKSLMRYMKVSIWYQGENVRRKYSYPR